MIKRLFWQTLLLLFSATLFLVSTSLFALSLSKSTVGLEQNTERVHQTVVPMGQLGAFELELVSEATDSGNDSGVFLLYQTSSLNIIQTEPKSFLKRQIIIEKELTRKSLLKGKRIEKSMFLYVIGSTWIIHEKSTGVYIKPTAFS